MDFTRWPKPSWSCSITEQNEERKNMKKFILIGLTLAAIAAAIAGPFATQSFINGTAILIEQPASATALSVPGLATSTSITYTNDLSQRVVAGTNAGGITYGSWSRAVAVRGDALGQVLPSSISVSTVAGTSNTITLTFQRSIDGTRWDTDTVWAFTTPSDVALVGITCVTNVPPWLLTGAAYLRCSGLSFATNSFGYTNGLPAIRFNNFAP
jgi:hypothetical protein